MLDLRSYRRRGLFDLVPDFVQHAALAKFLVGAPPVGNGTTPPTYTTLHTHEPVRRIPMTMKKLSLLPLALAFAFNVSMAANSVDIAVTGTITPSACNIILIGGDINYGNIQLNAASFAFTNLPTQNRSLEISCSGPTLVGIRGIDNSQNLPPLPQSTNFGLGLDASGNNIGGYYIGMEQFNSTLNGSSGFYRASTDGGVSWDFNGPIIVSSGDDWISSWSTTTFGSPAPISTLVQPLKIVTSISPSDNLDTSTEITINGSATIELVYL